MGGCTFVWAHGLGSSVAHEDALGEFDWAPVRQVANVVRYDARAHGDTPAVQFDHRAFRWAAGADDMLRAAGSGPFVAGGTGMGCVTALYTALRAPRRVHGLVLVTPPVAWEARDDEARRYEAAARMVEEHGVAAWVESLGDEVPQPWRQSVLAMEEKVLPGLLRGAAASDLPTREEVRSIVMPALVLGRTGDPGHPVATAKALSDLLVLSELHIAEDATAVRAWPDIVRDFLGGLCLWE